jgi:hypothetical protein
VQFPKLFRRTVTFKTDAKATEATLKSYLAAQKTQDHDDDDVSARSGATAPRADDAARRASIA